MKYWLTEFKAIDPNNGQLSRYLGPIVNAPSRLQADALVRDQHSYCTVVGQIISTKQEGEKIHYEYSTLTELEQSELN